MILDMQQEVAVNISPLAPLHLFFPRRRANVAVDSCPLEAFTCVAS